mmetsp:Transcript_41624/g.120550  ORF Transcript_41624/g.120550 Transcript_41624/m.120550 type:complete len:290 (-) Transcript_41624:1020-1889(-)
MARSARQHPKLNVLIDAQTTSQQPRLLFQKRKSKRPAMHSQVGLSSCRCCRPHSQQVPQPSQQRAWSARARHGPGWAPGCPSRQQADLRRTRAPKQRPVDRQALGSSSELGTHLPLVLGSWQQLPGPCRQHEHHTVATAICGGRQQSRLAGLGRQRGLAVDAAAGDRRRHSRPGRLVCLSGRPSAEREDLRLVCRPAYAAAELGTADGLRAGRNGGGSCRRGVAREAEALQAQRGAFCVQSALTGQVQSIEEVTDGAGVARLASRRAEAAARKLHQGPQCLASAHVFGV